MILLELLAGFLKIGFFSFGGAYSAIPLIREVVLSYGWLDDEKISYMIAVSESTPGSVMVNMATYIGSSQAGILGAMIATAAVVLPAFVIVFVITAVFFAVYYLSKKITKKGMSPIMLICLCGVAGILIYGRQ